jgi:hypothetical protein
MKGNSYACQVGAGLSWAALGAVLTFFPGNISNRVMALKVTFVNQNNKVQSFKVNLFGPARNRIKVANVLAVFKASVVVMGDGSIMEADDNGLSMDTFTAGSTYTITIVPIHESKQQTLQVAGESPLVVPMRTWGINAGGNSPFLCPPFAP